MAPATFADLPPELLDHITTYLPTAKALANLSLTSKSLHTFVEKDAWQTFNRTRFPSLHSHLSPVQKDVARSLATLSKAWDRRAFVARYIEPVGHVQSFPGNQKVERWRRPRGQTIGFTPHLDVREDVGPRRRDRTEILAFSAGAEVCVREKTTPGRHEDVRWMTYRPLNACEGRDDITTLHLLQAQAAEDGLDQHVITGTASGNLQLLHLPNKNRGDVSISHFITQGLHIRSSSVLEQAAKSPLLAVNMGDSRVSLYPVNKEETEIAVLDEIDIPPSQSRGHPVKHHRVWSTQFLSSETLAAGIGPSEEPIYVYSLTPSGFEKNVFRKFSLQNEPSRLDGETSLSNVAKKHTSSIYPIVPLPPSTTGGSHTQGSVFLSGAYDGVVRLHDMRSARNFEQAYVDPTDDSAIYSLLPRGHETLITGTSRHSLLKVFDMRLGAKCYSYLDAAQLSKSSNTDKNTPLHTSGTKDWSLFLKPTGSSQHGRGTWSRNRSAESSVYSLASPSPSSPFLYAGVENAVVELAFTAFLDRHPDPIYFSPWQAQRASKRDSRTGREAEDDPWRTREVLDLAMYEQSADMKLHTQKSMWETWRSRQNPMAYTLEFPRTQGLDERWKVGS